VYVYVYVRVRLLCAWLGLGLWLGQGCMVVRSGSFKPTVGVRGVCVRARVYSMRMVCLCVYVCMVCVCARVYSMCLCVYGVFVCVWCVCVCMVCARVYMVCVCVGQCGYVSRRVCDSRVYDCMGICVSVWKCVCMYVCVWL